MDSLSNMILQMCPDGVDYKKIKDIADVGTGSSDRKNAVDEGEYPFYVRSKNILKSDKYLFDETAIIIPGEGGVGEIFHYVDGKYDLHQRAYRIHFTDEGILPKFAYYYFCNSFKQFILKKSVEATVTSIRKPMIEEFMIPVPPLELQTEIVSILDKMTATTEELIGVIREEYEARKKQYDGYLNYIISKYDNGEKVKLSTLFDFRNGLSKGKEYFGRGIPFIRYTDVYNNRSLRSDTINALVECSQDEVDKLRVKRGDVLFTRTSETAEDVGWSSVMLDDIENCVFNGFTIKATPKTNDLLPEYCAYCFSTDDFRQYVSSHCAFTTRASLTGKTIAEYEMSVPNMDDQKRIAETLDDMHRLFRSILEELLDEIRVRNTQYEYYRDKMLTFKQAV